MASRETMVMDLCQDSDRLQYDSEDNKRIATVAAQFTQSAMLMIEALGAFAEAGAAKIDENSVDIMKGARADVVMAWGALQAVTSKIAGVMRIDGDAAFERLLLNATDGGEDPDVSGL